MVVAVQVSVAAFAPQDAAARAALEVAWGALCHRGDKSPGQGQLSRGRRGSVAGGDYNYDERLRTVHAGLGQQAGGVAALLWELAAVGVLGPLQSHNAQHRLALCFGVTTQQPVTTRQKRVT